MGNNRFKHKNFQKQPVDNYVPVGKPEDLNRKIEELNLSTHTYEALKAGAVVTLNDLCKQRMSKMYRIQNIGKRNCLEIAAKLKNYNLAFRPEEPLDNNKKPQQNFANNNQKQNPNQNKAQNNNSNNQNQQAQQRPQQKNGFNFSIFDDRRLVEFLEGQREKEIVKWEEEPVQKLGILKFCRNGKWGYKDQKGNVLIQPAYDEAFQFSEDMACVEKNGKLGYIDKQGNVVIDFMYDCANSFTEGLACVTKDEKTGYIGKDGNYVFESKYEVGTPFSNGKALIKEDGKWGVLAKDGTIYWR